MEFSWTIAGNITLALFTIAASGVVAAVVTHKLSVSNADRAYLRLKIEELFLAFEQYSKGVVAHAFMHIPYLQGRMSRSSITDMQLNNIDKQNGLEFDRTRMLISVHFPELQGSFDAFTAARDEANSLISAFQNLGERPSSELSIRYSDAVKLVGKSADDFRSAVIQRSRAITL